MTRTETVVSHGDLSATGVAAPVPGPQAAAARAAVVRALEGHDSALASWETGSAAFGRADALSDVDVCVIARDGEGVGTSILDAIESELSELADLDIWDVGTSTFGVQRFWQPAQPGADAPICLVDVSVVARDADADKVREFTLPERHGKALPLHDPDGVLAAAIADSRFDADAHRAGIQSELDRIRDRRNVLASYAEKELDRGRTLDAHWVHNAMVVAPLVALLGMVHRPLRFDFALRYLHEELPGDVVECLEPIVEPGREHLRAASIEGIEWMDAILDAIDPDLLPIERHAAEMRAAFG